MPNGSSSHSALASAEPSAPPPPKQAGPDPLLGRTVNERFRITGLIARGGMGKVYKAEQSPLGRVCAIKVLNPNYNGDHDPEFHKRFFLEASISSKLTHPNTVTIFDYGRTDDNIYYMAMEYLEGRTLHRTLREEGPFSEERTTHIARQICRSLREAHSLGVIHRDLKPANVYLIEHGDEIDFVKVLDFGLVKNVEEKGEDLTQTGLFMGSPKYMAPEQIRGERVDARTDIYALGIIMYEMITGKVPFDRPNSVNILMAHVNEPIPPLREMNPAVNCSEAFEHIIYKCVEKNCDDRFRSMDEVLAALKRIGLGAATGTISGGADRSGSFDLLHTTGNFTPPHNVSPLSPDPSGSGANVLSTNSAGVIVQTVEQKRSKAPFIVVAAIAIAAAAGVVLILSSKKNEVTASTPTNEPTKTQPANTKVLNPGTTVTVTAKEPTTSIPTIASPTTPVATGPSTVTIDTDPAGAVVKENDVIICQKTGGDSCAIDVTDGKAHTVKIELKDYKTVQLQVKQGMVLDKQKLELAPKWYPPHPPTTTTTGAPPVTTVPPNGFKPDPFG